MALALKIHPGTYLYLQKNDVYCTADDNRMKFMCLELARKTNTINQMFNVHYTYAH